MKKGTLLAIGFGAASAVAAMLYIQNKKEIANLNSMKKFKMNFNEKESNEGLNEEVEELEEEVEEEKEKILEEN